MYTVTFTLLYLVIHVACCISQGKYMEIQFSRGGQPDGGKISNFLLEKVSIHTHTHVHAHDTHTHTYVHACTTCACMHHMRTHAHMHTPVHVVVMMSHTVGFCVHAV